MRPAFQCTVETLPTALMAATVSGATDATKMMKTAARSPTPNQRIASGIQASAEIGRTISTSGADGQSAAPVPGEKDPERDSDGTARRYPQVTRKRDATTCLKRNPFSRELPDRSSDREGTGQKRDVAQANGKIPGDDEHEEAGEGRRAREERRAKTARSHSRRFQNGESSRPPLSSSRG